MRCIQSHADFSPGKQDEQEEEGGVMSTHVMG